MAITHMTKEEIINHLTGESGGTMNEPTMLVSELLLMKERDDLRANVARLTTELTHHWARAKDLERALEKIAAMKPRPPFADRAVCLEQAIDIAESALRGP